MHIGNRLTFVFRGALLLGASVFCAERVAAAEPVTIPFELVNRTIFVKVSVGSSRPLSFVLDTGDKYSVIDLTLARSLGIDMGDPIPVSGGGEKAIHGYPVKAAKFTVGGLEHFTQPLFIALPLTDLARASGHEFAGILGFDFISQFVVEIDYVRRLLTLHDSSDYVYGGTGDVLPITFNTAGHPQVRGRVVEPGRPPLDGTYVVDLGSGAAIILNTPFVEAGHLLEGGRRTVPWLEGHALGGNVAGQVGRIAAFQLGPFTIDNPVTIFSRARVGPFASSDAQGNIGAAILEKFKLILDYRRNRIILEPNDRFDEPIEYSRSGMSLTSEGEDFTSFRIDAVAEHSPASEAGLRAGDVLEAVDGQRASNYTLWQIRLHFKDASLCRLRVRRGEQHLEVALKLRPII